MRMLHSKYLFYHLLHYLKASMLLLPNKTLWRWGFRLHISYGKLSRKAALILMLFHLRVL